MMFDARFFAFATLSALLVISPGATMAVVLEEAIESGRKAALLTVLGVNVANSTLALTSALGMAVIFVRWPWALETVKVGGAIYLTWLGARGIWRAVGGEVTASATLGSRLRPGHTPPATPAASIRRGVATNFLNPSVVVFYMTVPPQFISAADPFFTRFLVLAATHVSMSLLWLSVFAVSVGTLSERMVRPGVRRWMAGITGAVLIALGLTLVLR